MHCLVPKVLLANNQLSERAGSELYVCELAESLASRGVDVAVFALFPGALAEAFSTRTGLPVYGPQQLEELMRWAPDIIHSHHVTTFHLLGDLFPGVPRVHGILGLVPDLEQLPVNLAEASRVFAVSERGRDVIRARAPGLEVEVVRNWFDDRELRLAARMAPASNACHRLLVVSNHHAPERDAALDTLAAEGLVSWERAGAGAVPREITGAYLAEFDLVMSIGRTVLLAGAVGVPCIVADQHVSDGLLSAEVVDELAYHNFTGRARRLALTAEHLRAEIERSSRLDRDALSRRIRAGYSLSARSLHFLTVYEEVLAGWNRNETQLAPRRGEGMVYRDMAIHIAQLEAMMQSYRNSMSWRITAPMRKARAMARRWLSRSPGRHTAAQQQSH